MGGLLGKGKKRCLQRTCGGKAKGAAAGGRSWEERKKAEGCRCLTGPSAIGFRDPGQVTPAIGCEGRFSGHRACDAGQSLRREGAGLKVAGTNAAISKARSRGDTQ